MADFSIAFGITQRNEQGWSNHPSDKGLETWNGISRKYHPTWNGWLIIDRHKKMANFPSNLIGNQALNEQEFTFYKKNFWDVNRLDQIAHQGIANEIYDTGVNMGYKVAAEFLQTAYNLLSKNEQSYDKLVVDGILGTKTIQSINSHKYPSRVLKTLNILQGARYVKICEKDPSQEVFFAGWIERVAMG